MRQLHVVALSADGRFVLLAPSKDATKGSVKVALDARLTAAVRGELPRPGQSSAPASELTPKQIQARLRAGESVEQIAESAGVPAARVERFAGPVEGERARTIDAARAAVLTRARRGASAVPLEVAVSVHLQEVGVDPAEVQWSARRDDDGSWLVEAGFSSRGRRKRATWRYDSARRELTAADASSAVLGYVQSPDARPATKVVAARTAAARGRSAGTRGQPRTDRRSAAAAGVPSAAKASAKKAPVKKAPAKKAPVKKAPARKAPATKAPAQETPAKKPAAKKPAAKKPAARRKTPLLRVVPSPDEPTRSRASVPGWADVLLSTTPPSRPAGSRPPSH